MLLLFDISKWNVFADYKLLAQRSIGGFIKASEGVWPDRLFKTHWTETKKVGLLRGAYHFWRPDRTPKEQAERLFATVNETGDRGELPPVLDVELKGSASDILACLKEIERLFGKVPIVYTRAGLWDLLGSTTWAAKYPLWVAHYQVEDIRWSDTLLNALAQRKPILPAAWKNAGWKLWQFSQKGHGPDWGTKFPDSKAIDLNMFPGTVEELKTQVGISGPLPVPEPVEAPVPEDPWLSEALPQVGRMIKVVFPGLHLRREPLLADDNVKDVMNQGDRTVITNIFKDDNYIWCETGYRQWFAFKRRDGATFVEIVE